MVSPPLLVVGLLHPTRPGCPDSAPIAFGVYGVRSSCISRREGAVSVGGHMRAILKARSCRAGSRRSGGADSEGNSQRTQKGTRKRTHKRSLVRTCCAGSRRSGCRTRGTARRS